MTNTFATTQEIENQFAQMEQVLVQFIHNAFREEHNKHVPYAQIKKAYAKAMRKWARKDALKMKFGLVSDTITNEEQNAMFVEVAQIAIKTLEKQTRLKLAD